MNKSPAINNLLLSFLIILGVILFNSYSDFTLFHFPLDDAWIHRVYSRSFFLGNGFSYNTNQEAGETSPFFAIITSFVHITENNNHVVLAIKLFGTLTTIGYLIYFFKSLNFFNIFIVGALVLNSKIIFAALSGMENTLLLLLWTLSAYLFKSKRYLFSALIASLLSVTRPEGIMLLPFWTIAYFIIEKDLKKSIIFSLILLLPFLLFSLFCFFVSGHPLPNTFYVKASGFKFNIDKVDNLILIFESYSPLGLVLFFTGIISFIYFKKDVFYIIWYVIAPAIYLCCTLGSRNIQVQSYYWIRWLEPPIIIMIMISLVGVAKLLKHTFKNKLRLITFALAILIYLNLVKQKDNFIFERKKFHDDSVVIYNLNELPGKYLAENTPTNAVIATNDAGAMKYFSNREIIDILGLNDHEVALKKVSPITKINKSKYLMIYPLFFGAPQIDKNFKEIKSFNLKEHNTICNCLEQSKVVLYEK